MKKLGALKFLASGATLLTLTSCFNITGFMDPPTGDDALLSAARGCFDRGDFTCASNYYNQISANKSDAAKSEQAFEILAQAGAGMSVFLGAFGTGISNGGGFITKIANKLISGAGATNRALVWTALAKAPQITDAKTRGLVRFVAASTFIAEVLAEDAASATAIAASDYVANSATCTTTSVSTASCALASQCTAPSGKKIVTGSALTQSSLSACGASEVLGAPTLWMINAAMNDLNTASTELGISNGAFSLAASFGSISLGVNDYCFRFQLIANGIGSAQ